MMCAAARATAAMSSSPCCAACWRVSRHEGGLHPEWPSGRLERSSDHPAGGGAARRSRSHRHQGRLRRGRLWRLHGAARRTADLFLPGGHGPGRRPAGRDGRGARRRQRRAERAAEILPRPWRRPVRHLHAGHADGGRGPAAAEVAAQSRRGRGRVGRRALPLHRLRQDRRRRHGRRRRRCRPRRRPAPRSARASPGSTGWPRSRDATSSAPTGFRPMRCGSAWCARRTRGRASRWAIWRRFAGGWPPC